MTIRYRRKTYEKMVVICSAIKQKPMPAREIAVLLGISIGGAQKVLYEMLEYGYATSELVAQVRSRRAAFYSATELVPLEPIAVEVDTSDQKKHAERERELKATQEQFSAFPSWMVRIPQEVRK